MKKNKRDRTEQDWENVKILKQFKKRHKLTIRWHANLLDYGYESLAQYACGKVPIPKHLLRSMELFNMLTLEQRAVLKQRYQP